MKHIDKYFMILTVGIIGSGIIGLTILNTNIKGQTMKKLSTEREVVLNTETDGISESKTEEDQNIVLSDAEGAEESLTDEYLAEMEKVKSKQEELDQENRKGLEQSQLEQELLQLEEEIQRIRDQEMIQRENTVWETMISYRGYVISVCDSIEDLETSKNDAQKVMDILIDELQPDLLDSLYFHLDDYEIKMERQISAPDKVYYEISCIDSDMKLVRMVVSLDDNRLLSFTRDDLIAIDSYDSNSKQGLMENWAGTDRQKRQVYEEYLPLAQEIIKNNLHFSLIVESEFDPSDEDFFSVDNTWLNVGLGYRLEDGQFIQLIFSQIDQNWIGFVFIEK